MHFRNGHSVDIPWLEKAKCTLQEFCRNETFAKYLKTSSGGPRGGIFEVLRVTEKEKHLFHRNRRLERRSGGGKTQEPASAEGKKLAQGESNPNQLKTEALNDLLGRSASYFD